MQRFARLLVTLAFAALLIPAPGAAQAGADNRYAQLARDYFMAQFHANPVSATYVGIHRWDNLLGSFTAADYARQLALDRETLRTLAAIDRTQLSPRVHLDAEMLSNALHDDLLINGTMAMWRHQPDGYVQTASNGVFLLISRNFAPPLARLRATMSREAEIPMIYAMARRNLTAVDRDTATLAMQDATGSLDLLQTTIPQAFAGVGDAETRVEFRHATLVAVGATKSYIAYLKTTWIAHPKGTYAIGAANYSARLKYEEGVDLPLSEYLAIGEKALAQTRAQMIASAHAIHPGAGVTQVIAELSRQHPTAAGLIPAAQGDLVKLRAFVIAHHIIDLPPDARIAVTPTPPFMRSTTEAAEDSPGPLEQVAKQAYYYVTPVDPHDPPAVQQAYLASFNDYERPIVSAHEVYPGHFTNFVIDRHLPLTLSEKLLTATSFVEGWAHYDEQMMVDQGWGDGDPRVRFMQLREAIWRNARYVAGVKMHTQGMTVPQAIRFFETQAFLDPANARAEAYRGTQDATYGYYTLGKLEILKLRADYRKKLGPAFTLARFHHDLLQYGDPALPLLRPLLLGPSDDGKILPIICSAAPCTNA
ncbi:MAG TPA: DUF885 domain-containing protein [Candidatus Sulfotelmatobacter sp.]|nr:DUF885 domain-containing protein [Candidatus Sulfotelmatobacter sp.]